MERAQIFMYGQGITLGMPTDVKWGSHHKLLADVVRSKDAIISTLRSPEIKVNAAVTREAERCRKQFMNKADQIRELESIFRPLANGIKCVEGDAVEKSAGYSRACEAFAQAIEQVENSRFFEPELKLEMKQVYY